MNNLTSAFHSDNFNGYSNIKYQKNYLPAPSAPREEEIINATNPCYGSLPNSSTDSTMSTFREPRCLYVNIAILCISLAIFFYVMFGLVPDTVQYYNMKQELNTTKLTMEQCSAVNNDLKNVTDQLGGELTQCSKKLDNQTLLLTRSQQELETIKSTNRFMDERMTQLKDEIADLTTQLRLKDENIKFLERILQEKASQPAEPVVPWPYAQNDVSHNYPNVPIILPSLYVILGLFG